MICPRISPAAFLVLSLVSLLALGCEDKEARPVEAVAASGDGEPTAPPAVQDSGKLVEVPKDGKRFDPPVKPEQIPMGAWMCDMGTVHYAAMNKGDGKCPVCSMELKHKTDRGHDEVR